MAIGLLVAIVAAAVAAYLVPFYPFNVHSDPPVVVVPSSPTSTLAAWLPLNGTYTNYANSSNAPVLQGSSHCAGFDATTSWWTQTCTGSDGNTAATLALSYPPQSGNWTVCVAFSIASFAQPEPFLLSCDMGGSGSRTAADCGQVYYFATDTLLVGQINPNSPGIGYSVTQLHRDPHLAARVPELRAGHGVPHAVVQRGGRADGGDDALDHQLRRVDAGGQRGPH